MKTRPLIREHRAGNTKQTEQQIVQGEGITVALGEGPELLCGTPNKQAGPHWVRIKLNRDQTQPILLNSPWECKV